MLNAAVRLTVEVVGSVYPAAAAELEACALAMLSLCGRAAQYARMTLRMRMVKEKVRRDNNIHCLVRLVDVMLFFRMGLGCFWIELRVEAESVLCRVLKLKLIVFLLSAVLVAVVGGGGKKISLWRGESPAPPG